jgi:hypothetical protein
MTFKVGDKVKFLNDVGGGIVTKVRQQVAYVQNADGFEIPTPFSDLIIVQDSGFGDIKQTIEVPSKNSTTKKQESFFVPLTQDVIKEEVVEDETYGYNEDESITSENCTLNILLGLVPQKLKGRNEPDFQLFLISDCSYRMMYTLSLVKDNFVYGKKAGMVEDDSKLLLLSFTATELKTIQSIKIACIFYKKGIFLPHEPIIYEYKIDASEMSDPSNWRENDYFDEKAIVINITEESLLYEIERVVSENEDKLIIQKKSKDISPIKQLSTKTPSTHEMEEVDLHIEQLVDDFSGLSAGEIVDIQIGRFTIALDGAIRSNSKKIVFIHGVGNGKLKYEIRKALDTKYSKYRYQDASFKEYGYGATMVILK